jgi:hypothetical protein
MEENCGSKTLFLKKKKNNCLVEINNNHMWAFGAIYMLPFTSHNVSLNSVVEL